MDNTCHREKQDRINLKVGSIVKTDKTTPTIKFSHIRDQNHGDCNTVHETVV